jgi:SAM-dependent MidA family methyltransferase
VTALHQILLRRLNLGETLTFAEVMTQALYHQEHGYYGPGPRRIGRSGDFYTSVSVGPLYGRLLATLAQQTFEKLGQPSDFCVIEQAAHDGQLAEDILNACEYDYVIVEPNPRYETVQRRKLAAFGNRVSWTSSLANIPQRPALFLCNELPDAMPVHLVRWNGSSWNELWVSADDRDTLRLDPGPISKEELTTEIARLPRELPVGYTTEVGLAALHWVRELAAASFYGQIFIADYGLDHEELYSIERHTGTIRRYRNHKTDDDILEDLGECDLTTHVNFTRLKQVGEAAGLKEQAYSHQGRYLGKLGLPWLATLEGRPPDATIQALLRQYHSLTHPAFMGRSFRVLLMEKQKTP